MPLKPPPPPSPSPPPRPKPHSGGEGIPTPISLKFQQSASAGSPVHSGSLSHLGSSSLLRGSAAGNTGRIDPIPLPLPSTGNKVRTLSNDLFSQRIKDNFGIKNPSIDISENSPTPIWKEGVAYIKAGGTIFPVRTSRFATDGETWEIYSPSDPTKPGHPIKFEATDWKPNNNTGLQGGALAPLKLSTQEIDSYQASIPTEDQSLRPVELIGFARDSGFFLGKSGDLYLIDGQGNKFAARIVYDKVELISQHPDYSPIQIEPGIDKKPARSPNQAPVSWRLLSTLDDLADYIVPKQEEPKAREPIAGRPGLYRSTAAETRGDLYLDLKSNGAYIRVSDEGIIGGAAEYYLIKKGEMDEQIEFRNGQWNVARKFAGPSEGQFLGGLSVEMPPEIMKQHYAAEFFRNKSGFVLESIKIAYEKKRIVNVVFEKNISGYSMLADVLDGNTPLQVRGGSGRDSKLSFTPIQDPTLPTVKKPASKNSQAFWFSLASQPRVDRLGWPPAPTSITQQRITAFWNRMATTIRNNMEKLQADGFLLIKEYFSHSEASGNDVSAVGELRYGDDKFQVVISSHRVRFKNIDGSDIIGNLPRGLMQAQGLGPFAKEVIIRNQVLPRLL